MEISGDFSLDPQKWGPSFWHCFHYAATVLPEEPTEADQEIAKLFVETHGAMLPCPKCRGHFGKYITETPPDVSSGTAFRRWLVTFHNAVNDRTDLRPEKWTLEKADQLYRDDSPPKPKEEPTPPKPQVRTISAATNAKIQQRIAKQQQLTMGRVSGGDRRTLRPRTIRRVRRSATTEVRTILPPAPKKKKKGCGCNKKR